MAVKNVLVLGWTQGPHCCFWGRPKGHIVAFGADSKGTLLVGADPRGTLLVGADPRGTLLVGADPKGTVPFGKCLVRTLHGGKSRHAKGLVK